MFTYIMLPIKPAHFIDDKSSNESRYERLCRLDKILPVSVLMVSTWYSSIIIIYHFAPIANIIWACAFSLLRQTNNASALPYAHALYRHILFDIASNRVLIISFDEANRRHVIYDERSRKINDFRKCDISSLCYDRRYNSFMMLCLTTAYYWNL